MVVLAQHLVASLQSYKTFCIYICMYHYQWYICTTAEILLMRFCRAMIVKRELQQLCNLSII